MKDERKVYCILPTHNRVQYLKNILDILSAQTYKNHFIIVIDDGSTDGTSEYLGRRSDKNLVVLRGDGKLWWGGSIAAGMERALSMAGEVDYILLLNDDSIIDQHYITNIIEESSKNDFSTMVSPQYDSISNDLTFVGYKVDYHKQRITQVRTEPVDATVGRGLLLPVTVIRKIGKINARIFPHYMADVEYTARIRECKLPIGVAWGAPMYTDLSPSDQYIQDLGDFISRVHRRSKTNIFLGLKFFHRRGSIWTRLTAVPRFMSKLGGVALRKAIYK